MVKASARIAAFRPAMVLVQQAWLLPVSETSFPAAPRRDSCWLCTVDLQSLLMCRDASPSRVLVAGQTVCRGGGDASGKRSESDGYSGWDARAGTAEARGSLSKAGRWKPSPRPCRSGPEATMARSAKVPEG